MRSLKQIAEYAEAELRGDGDQVITGASPLSDAVQGDITLLDDASKLETLTGTCASAVVVNAPIEGCEIAQLIVDDVHAAFCKIIAEFRPQSSSDQAGVHPSANVDPSARVHPSASVGPNCVIAANTVIGPDCVLKCGVTIMENCTIGSSVCLFPGVVIYERTVIDDGVWVHAGSVLGAFGFGYRQADGQHHRTGQFGNVHVEKNVEIGAAVTIDRGTYGTTKIGEGTKIDNQVMIAHNCRIGKHNLICSQVGIAGSSSTGDYVVLAGQVGVKDHVNIGDGVIVGAQAGIMSDCAPGNLYMGSPASKQKEQMQIFAMWRRLPEMRRTIRELEKTVAILVKDNPGEAAKAA